MGLFKTLKKVKSINLKASLAVDAGLTAIMGIMLHDPHMVLAAVSSVAGQFGGVAPAIVAAGVMALKVGVGAYDASKIKSSVLDNALSERE